MGEMGMIGFRKWSVRTKKKKNKWKGRDKRRRWRWIGEMGMIGFLP